MSDDPGTETFLTSAELCLLDKTFSLSQYLSKAGVFQPFGSSEITHNGETLEACVLICLVLNEECRKKGIGMIYHLKPRMNRKYGHACDLVFKLEEWTDTFREQWDEATLVKRLELCAIHDAADYGEPHNQLALPC